MRFSNRVRLTSTEAFKHVFAQPIRSHDRYFTILARYNSLSIPRLGLSVSRKVIKNSVERNRIKRIIRESFRCQQIKLEHLDFIVISKPGLIREKNMVLFYSLEKHWMRFMHSYVR